MISVQPFREGHTTDNRRARLVLSFRAFGLFRVFGKLILSDLLNDDFAFDLLHDTFTVSCLSFLNGTFLHVFSTLMVSPLWTALNTLGCAGEE